MKTHKENLKRGVALFPNLLTTANLFCGFFSIIQSLNGNFLLSVWMILLAGVFDFADGKVARLTNTQSEFGIEYDSLSDLTTFCMAPAILVYQWAFTGFGKLGIAVSFFYFACGALRLARFNVQSESVEKSGFQGLPTPAAAGTLVSYVIFCHHFWGAETNWPYALMPLMILEGLLMVSHVQYRSFKKTQGRASFFLLGCLIGLIFLIILYHEVMLFLMGLIYISVGIFEWLLTSPQKIRNFSDVMGRIFAKKKELFFYNEDDEETASTNMAERMHEKNILKIHEKRQKEKKMS